MAKHKTTDVVIIGSGASGGPIAFDLAKSGMQVVMLEKGEWCPNDALNEDELAQLHLEMYRPSGEDDPTIIMSKGKMVAANTRLGQAFYLVGGGTVRYSATSWRFRQQDFKKKSTYGEVAGASLTDWPITYEDLEPYYTKAEEEIGVCGVAGEDHTEPFRSRNVLMPPLKEDNYEKLLSTAARKLGWHPFHLPLAIHSQANAAHGTTPCMQCGWCSGFPCRFRAKSSVDVVLYPRAKDTGHFTLKTKSYVTQITTDKKGKASGVEYINLESGKREFIACKAVVVAASGIQTTRLLLLSACGKHPNGLGNSSGLLGRNLMFHIECKASGKFDDIFTQQLYKKVGVHDFYFPKKEDAFINHRSIQSGSKSGPISFALSRPGFGESLTKDVQQNFLRTQELQCMVEDLPQHDNRVILSSTRKDAWGIPAPEVHHAYHDMDKRAAAAANDRIREFMEAAGAKDIAVPKVHDNVGGRYSWHLMGTARMGNDPAQSVVNRDCQAHDVSNLFIVDGSVFCSSAGLNPTLTMQAISFRTAARLQELVKEGKV